MSKFCLIVEVDDVDDVRFREELDAARTENEGVTIRTGSRSFSAEVASFGEPKVEIVHGRHPDYGCDLTVFLDGERVDHNMFDVDPGRGYERASWNERIEDTRTDESLTPAFRDHAVATLEEYSDNEFISD